MPARPQVQGRPLAMDDLVAWCIVPFDSRKRTPEERIAMLERLGFKRYAGLTDRRARSTCPTPPASSGSLGTAASASRRCGSGSRRIGPAS